MIWNKSPQKQLNEYDKSACESCDLNETYFFENFIIITNSHRQKISCFIEIVKPEQNYRNGTKKKNKEFKITLKIY